MRPSLSAATVRLPFRPRSEAWTLVSVELPLERVTRRRPIDFLLLIDRSSSMRGAPLYAAIDAATAVLGRLQPGDRFGVIAFDAEAQVLLRPTPFEPAVGHFLRRRLEGLTAGYGTNLEAALDTAVDLGFERSAPGAVRRALLLTDGYPSVGAHRPRELLALSGRLRLHDVSLSCASVGGGCDLPLLAALAEGGGGTLHAIGDVANIPAVVSAEVDGLEHAVYGESSLELRPDASVEELQLLHGLSTRREGADLQVSLGELAPGAVRAALFRSDARARVGRARVRLFDAAGKEAFFEERELLLGTADAEATVRVAESWLGLQLAEGLREAWAALRHSRAAMAARLDAALALAQAVENTAGATEHPLARRIAATRRQLELRASLESLRLQQAEDVSEITRIRVSRGADA